MNYKIKDMLRQNIGYIAVAFVSLVYILTAFLAIDRTGKTVARIIADGAIAFCLGVLINRLFDLQGMMSGEQEERVQRIKEEHSEIVFRVASHIELLDGWCEQENAKNYRLQRTKILARVGMKYEDCFDERGVAKPWTPKEENFHNRFLRKTEKRKARAYKKAVALELTPLIGGELTSDGGKYSDPYYFGRTKAQYEAQGSVGDVMIKLGITVIFGYYSVSVLDDFNFANLIWTTLQVALFLIMGVISMYRAHNFITDEFRGRIVKKIDNLQKFENYVSALTVAAQRKEETEDKNDGN